MHKRLIVTVAASLALAMAACGSNVATPGEGGGGQGGTGGNIGGAGGTCTTYADESGQKTVTVRFKNQTSQPIYLPGMCSGVQYAIRPTGGDDGTSYVYETSCLQTCEELQTDYPFDCGACAPLTYKLDAGQSLDVTWSGTHIQHGISMQQQCWFDTPLGTCSQIHAAAAGQYTVDVMGYSQCSGDCTCDPSGSCYGDPSGLMAYPNPASFSFPSDDLVEVVFDFCAFGCADSP
jgi:hypothetical protein